MIAEDWPPYEQIFRSYNIIAEDWPSLIHEPLIAEDRPLYEQIFGNYNITEEDWSPLIHESLIRQDSSSKRRLRFKKTSRKVWRLYQQNIHNYNIIAEDCPPLVHEPLIAEDRPLHEQIFGNYNIIAEDQPSLIHELLIPQKSSSIRRWKYEKTIREMVSRRVRQMGGYVKKIMFCKNISRRLRVIVIEVFFGEWIPIRKRIMVSRRVRGVGGLVTRVFFCNVGSHRVRSIRFGRVRGMGSRRVRREGRLATKAIFRKPDASVEEVEEVNEGLDDLLYLYDGVHLGRPGPQARNDRVE